MAVFCKCVKRREEKNEELGKFLQACISGTAVAIFFKFTT